jgi:hypothetical protein
VNVLNDAEGLKRMLALNDNQRDIPVILEAGKVTVGFGGT